MTRRLVGLAVAGVLAFGIVTASTGWTPACVLYTPDDAMYWVLFCWVDPPPPPPDIGS